MEIRYLIIIASLLTGFGVLIFFNLTKEKFAKLDLENHTIESLEKQMKITYISLMIFIIIIISSMSFFTYLYIISKHTFSDVWNNDLLLEIITAISTIVGLSLINYGIYLYERTLYNLLK